MKAEAHKKLLEILDRDGELTVSAVIKEARVKTSPLHGEFEWNEEKAAAAWIKHTARQLIKRVNVTIERNEDKVIHVPCAIGRQEGTYKRASTITDDIGEFERAMSQAVVRLRAAQNEVEILERMASKAGEHDRVAILSLALQGLSTAQGAIAKLH